MRRLTRLLLIPALLLVLATTAVAASPAQVDTVLASGLRVVVREDPARSLMHVSVLYAAGAAAEPDSLSGLAHLTEHLLQKGPRRRELKLVTLRCNAYTSAITMGFWSDCLPALLPRVLAVEADRMSAGAIPAGEFARERNVVLEELAYRGGVQETSPRAAAFRASFPGHPFGDPVGGTAETVARITADDVQRFVHDVIAPQNAVVIVEGPLPVAAALTLIGEHLGAVPARQIPARPPLPPLPGPAARQVIIDNRDHEGFRLAAAIRVPADTARDLVVADLALSHLERTFSSLAAHLLPGEIVLATSWYGAYDRPGPESQHRFDPDQDAQNAIYYFWRRVGRAVADLVNPQQREHHAEWLAATVAARRGPRWFSQTSVLVSDQRVPTLAEDAALAQQITLAEIHDFLARALVPQRTAIAVSHGHDSGRIAFRRLAGRAPRHEATGDDALAALTADAIDPVLALYAETHVLNLSVFSLANGVRVVCQHVPDDPQWHLVGWRRGDPVTDARRGKRPGICLLYNRTVSWDPQRAPDERGPRPWPHDAAFLLDPAGVLTFSAHDRRAEASALAASLVERFARDEFNLAGWASTLDQADWSFAIQRQRPVTRATAWRWSQVLGPDHPALSDLQPDPRTVRDIRYKDLQKLHRTVAATTGDLTLLAVGGVPTDDVRTILETTFGRRERARAWAAPPPPPGLETAVGTVVTASSEADVRLALTFPAAMPPARGDAAGLHLLLMEELLDGCLDARLRQRDGLTYRAHARLAVVAGWVLPEIHVTCHPDQAPAVLAAIGDELAAFAERDDAHAVARARLRLVTRLLRADGDVEALSGWLSVLSACGPVPDDPVATALALDTATVWRDLATLLPARRFAFSATGALLEDDLELLGF
jgi:predicted Zn-dependent peptidase